MAAITMNDLFGPSDAKTVVGFEHCRKCHPRFQFDYFDIPQWLRNYEIAHIQRGGNDPVLAKAVWKRYHMVLENSVDRMSMSKAVSVGETFAIVRPAPTVDVVAAITFAAIDNKVLVLFLGADEAYRNAGFGTQLLMLTLQCVGHRCCHGPRGVSMFLFANEAMNSRAWAFYTARGFGTASRPDSEVIPEFVNHPILSSFVCDEANLSDEANADEADVLKLLCLNGFPSFKFGYSSVARTPPCFLVDPYRPVHTEDIDDPMVYAQFPGKLSLKELNHCGTGMKLLQQPGTFQVHDDGPVGISKGYPKSQFVVSWASRAVIKTGQTMLNPTISMLMAWIQRDREAPIWTQLVTLVPTCVMIPLWNMHSLLLQYFNSCVYCGVDFEDLKTSTFHPVFDNERFMGYAEDVMVYIYANCEELFSKPYIVMFGEDLFMDWTCFVAVNAGAIGGVGGRYKGGDKVCGFFNYDPTVGDDQFQNRAIRDHDPHLFFLTLVRHVLCTAENGTACTNTDVPFHDISSFVNAFLNCAEIRYGEEYQVSLDERADFCGNRSFVQLALPQDYPLRLPPDVLHYSKLASIVFFIDFAVSVAGSCDFYWGGDGVVGGINPNMPLGCGKMGEFCFAIPVDFPFGEMLLKDHVRITKNRRNTAKCYRDLYGASTSRIMALVMNFVVVVVDRIACSGFGKVRTSRVEYKKLLRCRSEVAGGPTGLGKPFTDRAQAMGWTPLQDGTTSNTGASGWDAGVAGLQATTDLGQSPPVLVNENNVSGMDDGNNGDGGVDGGGGEDGGGDEDDNNSDGANGEGVNGAAGGGKDGGVDGDGVNGGGVDNDNGGDGANCEGVNGAAGGGKDGGVDGDGVDGGGVDNDNGGDGADGEGVDDWVDGDAAAGGGKDGGVDGDGVNDDLIWRLGSLPCVAPQPLPPPLPRKKLSAKKKRPLSPKNLIGVRPMNRNASKKCRGTHCGGGSGVEDTVGMVQGDAMSICVAGDQCECPDGSSSLLMHCQKCAPCSRCQKMGHFVCLQKRYDKQLCPRCFSIVRKRKIDLARTALCEKRASLLATYLEPPAELLPFESFVRPNISRRMKEALDCELIERDFLSQDDMKDKICAHNTELQKLRDDPQSFSSDGRTALLSEDASMRRLVPDWKKCFRKLKHNYLRNTLCCVKALRFDSNSSEFHALMEWEESATNVATGEEITVANSEKIKVRDEWVKNNFSSATYQYLKRLPHLSRGKFMPVPSAPLFMDTRQFTHFKWAVSRDHPEGRWMVRFANSDESPEEMKECDMMEAVGLPAMTMAKTFAQGKRGQFIPIPVGNSTGPRAVDVVPDVIIAFQQKHRQTCVYSSFASALWFLGLTELAVRVDSEAVRSEGDPFALKRLADLVHNHPTWMVPKRIKNSATSFKLLEHDLTNALAVVVLKGIPDRACNHAITVFDGLIFDSNEKFGIPLTRDNLDLMCSTDSREGKYECVAAGYLFIDSREGRFGIRDSNPLNKFS
jgi:GNAT superfamily N-acetyltransferase